MKNIKKIIALACSIFIIVGLFVGCGQKQQTLNNNTSNGEVEQKKIELILWEEDESSAQKVLDEIIKDFESKNSNITITRTHYGTEELRRSFLKASLSSSEPDIVLGPNDNIGVFAADNIIVPVDEVIGSDELSKYDETAIKAAQYLGKQYMLPDRSGNELLLIYNKKLVKEAPNTWEELEKIGKDLKDKIQYTIAFNEVEPFFTIPFLKAFGGEVFEDVNAEKPKVTLNTDAVKKWSQF